MELVSLIYKSNTHPGRLSAEAIFYGCFLDSSIEGAFSYFILRSEQVYYHQHYMPYTLGFCCIY